MIPYFCLVNISNATLIFRNPACSVTIPAHALAPRHDFFFHGGAGKKTIPHGYVNFIILSILLIIKHE